MLLSKPGEYKWIKALYMIGIGRIPVQTPKGAWQTKEPNLLTKL